VRAWPVRKPGCGAGGFIRHLNLKKKKKKLTCDEKKDKNGVCHSWVVVVVRWSQRRLRASTGLRGSSKKRKREGEELRKRIEKMKKKKRKKKDTSHKNRKRKKVKGSRLGGFVARICGGGWQRGLGCLQIIFFDSCLTSATFFPSVCDSRKKKTNKHKNHLLLSWSRGKIK